MYLKYLIGAVFSFSLVFGMLSASQSDFVSILFWLVPVNVGYFLLLYLSKNDRSVSFYLFIDLLIDKNSKEAFLKKLQLCMKNYDYKDETKDVRGKVS